MEERIEGLKNYMKITKDKLFFGILIIGLIANLLILFDIQYLYLRAILSFAFLTTIPGLLIMLMLKIRKIGFWEYLVYAIGLSMAFLMFAGLAINWILPWLHITEKPLSLIPLFISFNIFLSILGIIAYKRNKKILLLVKLPKLNWINKSFFLAPLIYPLLSVLGAITLNNGGSNYFTMIMLGGIAAYVFLVVLFRNKLNENIYPWGIIMMSASVLLSYSLRSWHITGWDIHQEYYVFQLTKNVGYWTINNYHDAYNAVLSISILPTIYSSLLKIPDEVIFKVLYPLIFSLIPLIIYLLLSRHTSKINAFLSSFFFISQSTFFIGFTMVLRQGIAILFFSLLLHVLINRKPSKISEINLLFIFGFSMIVSHYSTAYIALAILSLAYVFNFLVHKHDIKKYSSHLLPEINILLVRVKRNKFQIKGKTLLIFFLFTFFWYGQLTETASGFFTFTQETIKNLGRVFSSDALHEESSFINQFNIFYKQNLNHQLKKYINEIVNDYRNNPLVHLSQTTDDSYIPKITSSQMIPPRISPKFSSYMLLSIKIIKKIVKVLLVIGMFYLLILEAKKRRLNKEFILVTSSSLILLGIGILLSLVVVDYDLLRLYQQTLILLSLATVIGSLIIFNIFFNKIKYILAVSLFILFFLSTTSFIPQLVGGSKASMQLNNYGEDYDRFYVHESEIKSTQWFSSNYNKKNLVYADRFASWILLSFGNITKTHEDVLSTTLDRDSYVYLRYGNAVQNINFKRFEGKWLYFNYPTNYLDQNKDLIYNNMSSKIYR